MIFNSTQFNPVTGNSNQLKSTEFNSYQPAEFNSTQIQLNSIQVHIAIGDLNLIMIDIGEKAPDTDHLYQCISLDQISGLYYFLLFLLLM